MVRGIFLCSSNILRLASLLSVDMELPDGPGLYIVEVVPGVVFLVVLLPAALEK
jgi:hypothetical protein